MSGNGNAFRSMLKAMNHGGRVAILGIPPGEVALDWNQVIFKGLILKGVYGRENVRDLVQDDRDAPVGLDITPVLTHRFKIADFQAAFETMRSGQSGKVVLDWAA